ncbi:GGDEF domain-containing protein [Blastococcus xanthinilyticus]|uniref:Cyclic di-GMP phosphodiesterase Gmr n=1 Tax=Blastococcus xanthinilyticus TaxID=1564164 RepID=A0A5S5CRQ0_9ACTN|nr:diguanylate cyclase [Blastococcus xanthinilyticus]TYP86567.1 cyclic di-GMP phosphodiesterase Gmr [Blastococcus xanthinilyticus]
MTVQGASSPRPRTSAQDPVDLAHTFVQVVDALLCIVDGDGRILLGNPALQRFTGLDEDQLMGRRFWDVWVVADDIPQAREAVRAAVASGQAYALEADWVDGRGELHRVALRNTILLDDDGRPYAIACVGIDVTADRAREARLRHQTRTDLLTGVANRGALFDALRARLDGSGCGLLFCDLDDFKTVNDHYGHGMGDQLLAEAATRLVEVAGPDHMVARFGGDEFVVLCPAGDEHELAALSARVVTRLGMPFPGPEGPLSIGVSVGAAVGRSGESADAVIARADRAMYGAKSTQRRRAPRD